MSKQNRDNLKRHSKLSLDSLFEIAQMEDLTLEEYKEYHLIHEDLSKISIRVEQFVSSIDERKKGERLGVLIPTTYNGPCFSWVDHERKIKRDKLKKQLALLKQKLAEM